MITRIKDKIIREIQELRRIGDEIHYRDMYLEERKIERIRKNCRIIKCYCNIHDYCDDLDMQKPWHFYEYTCSYCERKFYI